MRRIAVLHLMNNFAESSISGIIERLITSIGNERIDWHVGGISPNGNMADIFLGLGACTTAFMSKGGAKRSPYRALRGYIQEHGIRIIHSHTPRATIMAAMAAKGRQKTQHLATRHSLHQPCERRWGLIYTLLDRISLYLPDRIVAVSNSMHDQIIAQPFIRAKSVMAIQNAIDCKKYYAPDQRAASRRELGFASDAIVLGSTGRIESGKRLSVLLRAFVPILQHWPNARLLVVGEGTRRRILSDLAARLNIAYAVKWTGFRSDIAHLLAAMDIYVQPSINEGLSLSILEAMAAQKPVVAVDIPGVREVIQDGHTGLLVPRSSPSSLQAALTDLLCQPGKQALIGQNARSYVCAKFDLQSMTSAYKDVYHALAIK
jgi:glycosyltransferase involved in cell wall biosynthesis